MWDFESHEKRHTPEPDLVPILDALTSVIFFLLLSTSFFELTKITLPPSKTSVVTDPVASIPVAAKMIVGPTNQANQKNEQKPLLRLLLKWDGKNPGSIEKTVERADDNTKSNELQKQIKEMVAEFSAKFPEEKSIQLGMGSSATYQELVTTMDGVRAVLQDIVLFSNQEAEAILNTEGH